MKIHRPGLSKSGSPPPLTISQSQAPRTANCGVVHTLFSAEGCSARVKNPTRTRELPFGLLHPPPGTFRGHPRQILKLEPLALGCH